MSTTNEAAAGTAIPSGGSSSKAKANTRKSYRKPSRKSKPDETLPASIYIGLDHIADVEPKGGRWTAIDPHGVVIGVYETRRAATAAVLEARR